MPMRSAASMRVLAIGPDMGAFTLRIGFLGYLILYLPRDHKRKLFLAIPTTTVWALRDLGLEFRGFGVLGLCLSLPGICLLFGHN